jgi:RNA polymerase sigma-70 factor (ECF subfamily)
VRFKTGKGSAPKQAGLFWASLLTGILPNGITFASYPKACWSNGVHRLVNTPASLLMRLRQPAERAAWGEFVRLYTPILYQWAWRLGLRGQDADDLVQEVFLLLVQKLPSFTYDRNKSFRAWLRTVLLNKWRTNQRKAALVSPTNLAADDVPGPDYAGELEEAEYRTYLVGRALRLMQADFEPTTWRACWEYVIRGRPPAEVAAELGVSIAVVYSAKCRVLRHLRRELEGLLD